jgi:hypothetical protein
MAAKRSKPLLKASLNAAIAALARALAQVPAPGMLIGGIAVIARGVPRTTRDVDATVSGERSHLDDVLRILEVHELLPRIVDARTFAEANQVLLLRHAPSGVDVDLSLAWLPFELEAIDAAEELSIGKARVRVARPEDLVIYKAVAWRPQDRQDVEPRLLARAQASHSTSTVLPAGAYGTRWPAMGLPFTLSETLPPRPWFLTRIL